MAIDARDAPRIGFVAGWMDPSNVATWSGVPAGLMSGLRAVGVFAGYRDGTPFHRPTRVVRRARLAVSGLDRAWMFGPEVRALTAVTNWWRHRRPDLDVDAWVQPAGAFGRPMPGRLAVIVESTPAQLQALPLVWARSFWADATPRTLAVLARQQARLFRAADALCTPSTWAAASLVRDHGVEPAKVHVVGYGANVEIRVDRRDWSRPRFLFVGRDWNRKNGDLVVRAFAELRRSVPHAVLDLVGDHPRVDVDGVIGHGAVDLSTPPGRAFLELLYRRATCFVLPSHVEPFGMAYVEAGRAGLASIGTTVGGAADAIGPGGVLVDPSDIDDLIVAMHRFVDAAVARDAGAAARRHSDRFSWEAVARRIVAALGLPLPVDPIDGRLDEILDARAPTAIVESLDVAAGSVEV